LSELVVWIDKLRPRLARNGRGSGSVFNYLIMTAGPRSGTQFLLTEGKQNRIGRGLDCDIILADPLASRVHAIVLSQEGD
jgi:pSer/pThr/pTyr-binding forkhead associated (FHA) protein